MQVKEITCPSCRSADDVSGNSTNFATEYYCSDCKTGFNPPTCPCPGCGTDVEVTKNPLDGYREYYCYGCNMAFNRLGPSFGSENIEYGTLEDGFKTPTAALSLTTETGKQPPRDSIRLTLQNTGLTSIDVRGRRPIAIQRRVGQNDWWTVYGNPHRCTVRKRTDLRPDETLHWNLRFGWKGISGPEFSVSQKLLSGQYRIVYWGIPETQKVLAVRVRVDI